MKVSLPFASAWPNKIADDVRRRRRIGALLLFASVTLFAVTAHGEKEPLDVAMAQRMLHVKPGATCLSADDLAADIPRWLQGDSLATDVEVWVDGSPTDPRTVRVRLLRAGDELARREFDPGPVDCAELHSAVSLSIALALRVTIRAEPKPPPGTPLPTPPPPSTPKTRAFSLFVGGLAMFGLLPDPLLGSEVRAELTMGRYFMLRAGALGLVAREVRLPETSAKFDSYAVAARISGCGRITLKGPVEGHACAGVLGGALFVRGRDDDAPPRQTLAWPAFVSELGLTVAATRHLLFSIEPGLVVPLREVRIGIVDTNDNVVTSIPLRAIAFSLGLGAAYRL